LRIRAIVSSGLRHLLDEELERDAGVGDARAGFHEHLSATKAAMQSGRSTILSACDGRRNRMIM
jgi:hypothetical protein